MKLQHETAEKATRMIGIGPVDLEYINEVYRETKNYEMAKMKGVKKFLQKELLYDDEEIEEINILGTKMGKLDNIIYIALQNTEECKEIYTRKAEIQNDKITVRNFIPPQFHEKFMKLNQICAERRSENPQLKTQLRFNNKDIEILVKMKGTNEPLTKVKMIDFLREGDKVPEFDTTVKWKQILDRPPRRKINPIQPINKQTDIQTNKNVRNRSQEEDTTMKRQRTVALIEIDVDGTFTTPAGKQNIEDIQ